MVLGFGKRAWRGLISQPAQIVKGDHSFYRKLSTICVQGAKSKKILLQVPHESCSISPVWSSVGWIQTQRTCSLGLSAGVSHLVSARSSRCRLAYRLLLGARDALWSRFLPALWRCLCFHSFSFSVRRRDGQFPLSRENMDCLAPLVTKRGRC